jgi:hypothetical protein
MTTIVKKGFKSLNNFKKIKIRKDYLDLDRRMQKIINGKAEFISLKDVKKLLNH